MNLTPLRKNVIIERLEKDMRTASGIILQRNDEADKAKVIAIGNEVTDVMIDDVVLINWNDAKRINDTTFRIEESSIIAVFD